MQALLLQEERILMQVFYDCSKRIYEIAGEQLRGRDGGVFRLYQRKVGSEENPLEIFSKLIGEVTDLTRYKMFQFFSREKVERLAQFSGHVSSAQSRNKEEKKYAGAIRVEVGEFEYFLSFSGFPDDLDEIFVMLVADRMRWLSRPRRIEIFHVGNNPYANDFCELNK